VDLTSGSQEASKISGEDGKSFISIHALYDALDTYLIQGSKSAWKKFKRHHPGFGKVEQLYQCASEFWEKFSCCFPPLKELKESSTEQKIAEKYRTTEGGNVLFRPIGLLMLVKVVRRLIDYNKLNLEQALERVSKVPMELSSEPWAHLIWNPLSKQIITASPNRRAAEKLLFYSVGGDLTVLKSDPNTLKKELADIKNEDSENITLPLYA